MNDELQKRVLEALDREGGIASDAGLADALAADPDARAFADDLVTHQAAFDAWPETLRSDDAWEALATRIEQRLGETLPVGSDPTGPPILADPDGQPPKAAWKPPTPRVPLKPPGDYSLANLTKLGMKGGGGPAPAPVPRGTLSTQKLKLSDVEIVDEAAEGRVSSVELDLSDAEVVSVTPVRSAPPPTPPPSPSVVTSPPPTRIGGSAQRPPVVPTVAGAVPPVTPRAPTAAVPIVPATPMPVTPAPVTPPVAAAAVPAAPELAAPEPVAPEPVTPEPVEAAEVPISIAPQPIEDVSPAPAPAASIPAAIVGTPVEAAPRPMPRTDERIEIPSLEAKPRGHQLSAPTPILGAGEPRRKSRGAPALIVGSLLAAAAIVALAIVATQGEDQAEQSAALAPTVTAEMPTTEGAAYDTVTSSPTPSAPTAAAPEAAPALEPAMAEEAAESFAGAAPPPAEARDELAERGRPRMRRAMMRTSTTAEEARVESPPPSTVRGGEPEGRPSGPAAGAPGTPSREDVSSALGAVQPFVSACRAARGGVVRVNITVAGSGRVRNAVVVGEFAGTREGSCVARAVRRARFPEFRRESFSVQYPFQL